MLEEVDIIVTGADATEVRLIVEAKLAVRDITSAEQNLKRAMMQMSSPVGLLVSPERIWVYSDQYVSQTPESVVQVGNFDISHLIHFQPGSVSPDEVYRFESAVQHWLEDLLRIAPEIRRTNDTFWNVLNTYVLPAVEAGQVRAAAPRFRS